MNKKGLFIVGLILATVFCIGTTIVPSAQAASIAVTATALVPGNNLIGTLIVEPKAVMADGQSQAAILVLVNNADGEPINNQTVTLSTSRPDKDTVENTQQITGVNGVAIFKIKSQFSGDTSITASIDDQVIGTAKLSFFSRSRAFLLVSNPLILIAGLFITFEILRWLWLLGFWHKSSEKRSPRDFGYHSRS